MKPKTQTLVAVIAISCFSLLACDPGRKELNQVKERYQDAIQNPTAKENIAQIPGLVQSLATVAAKNEKNNSGKRAQEQLQEIMVKVEAKESDVKKEILNKVVESLKSDSELVKKANQFTTLARTPWNEKKTPLRSSQCIITPAPIDSGMPVFSAFQAFEVQTIASNRKTDGIAIQPIYRSGPDDSFHKSGYIRGQWQKHSIAMFALGSIVNCNDIKNFAEDYLNTIDKVLTPYLEQYKEEIHALTLLRNRAQ